MRALTAIMKIFIMMVINVITIVQNVVKRLIATGSISERRAFPKSRRFFIFVIGSSILLGTRRNYAVRYDEAL